VVGIPTDEPQRCAIDESQAGPVDHLLILSPAEDGGYCRLELPLQGCSAVGFSLEYPDSWKVILAGPEGLTPSVRYPTAKAPYEAVDHDRPPPGAGGRGDLCV
jgi:hypothetical protein